MAAPDLAQAVVGYRAWRVTAHESIDPRWPYVPRGKCGKYRLFSLTHAQRWPTLEALEAECRKYRVSGARHRPPGAPKVNCCCGTYAFKGVQAHRVMSHLAHDEVAIGEVNLWGRLIEHLYGWRAQYAYPRRLVLLSAPVPPRRRSKWVSRLAAMANDLADYGVPVSVVTIDVKRIFDHEVDGAIMFKHV
jgi:hypothetical protein